MFTLFYIFILESNIKKYKDEKSLQETGIVLLVSDGIAKYYDLLKIQTNKIVKFKNRTKTIKN